MGDRGYAWGAGGHAWGVRWEGVGATPGAGPACGIVFGAYVGVRVASPGLWQGPPHPSLLSSTSDYVIDDKVAVLQKRDHEGFGFVLRGAKGNMKDWGGVHVREWGVRLAGAVTAWGTFSAWPLSCPS